jgi:thiamine-phosphate pyrophosphorylase
VRAVAAQVRIPWFAIGGIDLSTAAAAIDAGARRVAVVRAISDAHHVEAATRELLAAVTRAEAVA